MLNDYLQRNAADYEAYNLLLKVFYSTGRYDVASDLIGIILKEYEGNRCFANNLLLCEILLGRVDKQNLMKNNAKNPFIAYNQAVLLEKPSSWDKEGNVPLKSKLLFQEFQLGDPKRCGSNIFVAENREGEQTKFSQPIITIGRLEDNDIVFQHQSVSRRHSLVVNYTNQVWLYNLDSTHGTFCDGRPVKTSVFLDGRHKIRIADSELIVFAKEGILL